MLRRTSFIELYSHRMKCDSLVGLTRLVEVVLALFIT